jgi:hypothetical protein
VAIATARNLLSKDQIEIFRDAYLTAISRPLIHLGRTIEARQALTECLERGKADSHSSYADRLGDISVRQIWPTLLLAESKPAEARQALNELIDDTEQLRAGHTEDLTPIYFLSRSCRLLASITTGQERREALLRSAAAWRSWPATSYTRREEQRDYAAAGT